MYRFYQGKSSRNITLLLGLVAELFPILIAVPTILASNQLPIPLPILFLTGLVLIYLSPPVTDQSTWKSLEEPKEWHSESTSDE
jgi:hypothetical protein